MVFQDGLEHVELRGVLGVVGDVEEGRDGGEDGGVEDAGAVGGGAIAVIVVRVGSGDGLAVGDTGVAAVDGGEVGTGVTAGLQCGVYGRRGRPE